MTESIAPPITYRALVMTDERTGESTKFHYRATSFGNVADDGSLSPSSLKPQNDLVSGSTELTFAATIELTDEKGDKDEIKKSPWPGRICRAACWGVAGLATGVVAVACTGASVITVGGVAIPCSVAIIACAAGSAVGASLCSDAICPP